MEEARLKGGLQLNSKKNLLKKKFFDILDLLLVCLASKFQKC